MSDFDVSMIEAAETATFDVMDLKGDPMVIGGKTVTVELYGPGSDQYIAAQAKMDRDVQNIAVAAAIAANQKKNQKDTTDDMRRINLERLTACTKQFNGLPLTPEAVFRNKKLGYIHKQVERLLGDWANFMKSSLKN